ncbi:MAG: PD-(D/E)XK nuclease family protein [Candidatus Gastranaerophilales bacterium]|nr:PD-(D/E)XK nuclease family protein [Candidatus Gastranaerophilales bacterium]
MIDTFSANSLKVLDKSLDEFINKYEYHLSIFKKDKRAVLGSKYHSLICQYLKGYDITKMKLELSDSNVFDKFLKSINRDNFIKTEYPFLIKCELNNIPYYLTGRYDAIYHDKGFIIYDWKTLNIPQDVENDLQTIVYLYTLSLIFKTQDIKMRYISIEKSEYKDVEYKNSNYYKKRIDEIIGKYYNSF